MEEYGNNNMKRIGCRSGKLSVGTLHPVFLSLAVFCLMLFSASAQTVRIVRTDGSAAASSFITATQSFGIDIVIDSITNCTSASFELKYTNAKHVVFSHWKARDLGKRGVFVYDLTDTAGNGSVHVGALSGLGPTDPGLRNPIAIHLDFVVLPDAPNDSTVTFTFQYPQAVVSDSGGMIVTLASQPYTVRIHGFVDVFPGDADNNGVVDSRDATMVGAFLKQGSGSANVRGFKRYPASTLWRPQASLVWDSAKATYADCDGSGDVTLGDNLVVQINFGKTHSSIQKSNIIQSAPRTSFPQEFIRVPLYIKAEEALLGVALRARLLTSEAKLVGFEPAPNLNSVESSLVLSENGEAIVVFGSQKGLNAIPSSGNVGSFVFESVPSALVFEEMLGATSDGRVFPLTTLSSACPDNEAEVDNTVRVNATDNGLLVSGLSGDLTVYRYDGSEVARGTVDDNGFMVLPLPAGTYILYSTRQQQGCVFVR